MLGGQLLHKGENRGWEGWVPCTEQCKWFSKSTSAWPESPLSWPQYPSKTSIKPCQAHRGHDANVTCSLGFTANARNASQARCLCANAHWPLRKTTNKSRGDRDTSGLQNRDSPLLNVPGWPRACQHLSVSDWPQPPSPSPLHYTKSQPLPQSWSHVPLPPARIQRGRHVGRTQNSMLQLKNLSLPFSTCTWKRKPKHIWG